MLHSVLRLAAASPRHITILTGAGISAESGVPTFRDSNGLWCSHRVEDVACPGAFVQNPELVHRFYNERRRNLLIESVVPNAAHIALAKLQQKHQNGKVTVITQNIDNLHERAGSVNVIHMHGELLKVRCSRTGMLFDCKDDIKWQQDRCECCDKLGTLRPHVVWFGEMPLYMDQIENILADTNLFVAIGTSGNVYPAAGFVSEAKFHGAQTLELNFEQGSNGSVFDKAVYGKASVIVPEWVESVLSHDE